MARVRPASSACPAAWWSAGRAARPPASPKRTMVQQMQPKTSPRPPGARHLPVAFTQVELTDRQWAPRQQVVRERTVPFLYGQMVKIGTIEALDVTQPPGPLAFPYRKNNTSTSVMYWDADIAKCI